MGFKAAAALKKSDMAHLAWLRHRLGGSLLGGAATHVVPVACGMEDRILAVPLCAACG